ncbi:hypothetical protein ACO0QE_002284 [Hanseniaspora vineae]
MSGPTREIVHKENLPSISAKNTTSPTLVPISNVYSSNPSITSSQSNIRGSVKISSFLHPDENTSDKNQVNTIKETVLVKEKEQTNMAVGDQGFSNAEQENKKSPVPSTMNKSQDTPGRAPNAATSTAKTSQKQPSNKETEKAPKKPRKRRKTYSCESCRNLKTRCDFQPFLGKCHRCVVLGLSCSLTSENNAQTNETTAKDQSNAHQLLTQGIPVMPSSISSLSERMNTMEANLKSVDHKLNVILSLFQHNLNEGSNDLFETANNYSSEEDNEGSADAENHNNSSAGFNDDAKPKTGGKRSYGQIEFPQSQLCTAHGVISKDPPFKLLDDIDKSLFSTKASTEKDAIAKSQRPFVVARNRFMEFFIKHEEMCYELSKEFLVKAHFWIIPGGRKKIDREYVENHAFITSVLTIIAMGFDENNKYEKEQEELYPIVETLLSNTLTMFNKLIDHDIEAILYCCMFSISRKSQRYRQLKLNSLILCNFALNSLLTIINFHKIKEKVSSEKYDADDLFHLRILNSLTACKLEYSIGYGNYTIQDEQLKEFNDLTAKFPQTNFGDEIKLSEINLGDIVNAIFLNFKDYSTKCVESFEKKPTKILTFKELQYWLKNWHELSCKDGGGVLLFTFDFYHILICRTLLKEYCDKNAFETHTLFFKTCLKTISDYCFSLLHGFLKLPPSLIKGAPSITLHQAVYSCLTLCDYLHCFDVQEKQKILNTCTKIYWHLNTIGEKLNEATQNVGMIIKNLIDTGKAKLSSNSEDLNDEQLFARIQQGSLHSSFTKNPLRGKTKTVSSDKKQTRLKSVENGARNDSKQNSPVHATPTYAESLYSNEKTSTGGTPGSTGAISQTNTTSLLNFPDVEQFQSFEDFFQDFFYNLKPTSQNMFSSLDE